MRRVNFTKLERVHKPPSRRSIKPSVPKFAISLSEVVSELFQVIALIVTTNGTVNTELFLFWLALATLYLTCRRGLPIKVSS